MYSRLLPKPNARREVEAPGLNALAGRAARCIEQPLRRRGACSPKPLLRLIRTFPLLAPTSRRSLRFGKKSSNRQISFQRQSGISLIELLLFIVIVGVAVSGVLVAFNISVQKSADPLVRKQVMAIAESMMEEVQLMPFTFCDPDDANARTATSATVGPGGCAATVEALGPEAGENRYATGGVQFDNVNDYHGYNSATEAPPGIKDISGTSIAALAGYNVSVTITSLAIGASAGSLLRIQVIGTGPGNTTITLHGFRSRYAPRSTP